MTTVEGSSDPLDAGAIDEINTARLHDLFGGVVKRAAVLDFIDDEDEDEDE